MGQTNSRLAPCAPTEPPPEAAPEETSTTGSLLLDLPAELRNRIYFAALVSEDPIKVDRNNFGPPEILATNRQIRAEASAIYYCDNTFRIDCTNFDSKVLWAFIDRSAKYTLHLPAKELECAFTGEPTSWPNLLEWVKSVRDHAMGSTGVLRGTFAAGSGPDIFHVAAKVFSISEKLMGLSWPQVVEILDEVKEVSEKEQISWS